MDLIWPTGCSLLTPVLQGSRVGSFMLFSLEINKELSVSNSINQQTCKSSMFYMVHGVKEFTFRKKRHKYIKTKQPHKAACATR